MDIAHRLSHLLSELEAELERGELERRADRVSGWSIGDQLDHVTQVLAGGLDRLEAPGEAPRGRINLTGRLLLGLGWLPRGVGKSPRAVLPRGAADDELRGRLAAARAALTRVATAGRLADRRPVLAHPYFGTLDVGQALRFLEVHTKHHLKIVRDIRNAGARA